MEKETVYPVVRKSDWSSCSPPHSTFFASLWNFITMPSPKPTHQGVVTDALSLDSHQEPPLVGQVAESSCWKDGGQSNQLQQAWHGGQMPLQEGGGDGLRRDILESENTWCQYRACAPCSKKSVFPPVLWMWLTFANLQAMKHHTPFAQNIHLHSPPVVVVQLLGHARLSATPWTAACQASLSFINSQSLPKFMSFESVMLFNHGALELANSDH